MSKFRLSDAPTALIEPLGHLDETLQKIREVAKLGSHATTLRADRCGDRVCQPAASGSGDLDALTDVVTMDDEHDKYAHSVVFVHSDPRNGRQTSIQIQMENAVCFLVTAIGRIHLQKEMTLYHICDLNRELRLHKSFNSPRTASLIFWTYCKSAFARTVTNSKNDIKITGLPRGGKDREIIPNDVFESSMVDIYNGNDLNLVERNRAIRVDWKHDRFVYEQQLWTNVNIFVRNSFFVGEREKRKSRIDRCVELLVSQDKPSFSQCRERVLHLKASEFAESWRTVERRRIVSRGVV